MLIWKRQSLKGSSIYFYREIVCNNRSFLFYIFRLKNVIQYFIHCFSLFWFPVQLWFPYKCAGHQSTLLFSIKTPRFYRYLVIWKVAMCHFSTSDESFQNHHYLAGTHVTVKLALRAGPSGQHVILRKRKSLKASSIYFYSEIVLNNRSFLFYIFRFKTVIQYFIHCFCLFWFPVLLWFL
jgi:hypothetical protein